MNTKLQEAEENALVWHKASIKQVVNALRLYRRAVSNMLALRYSDGECDGDTLARFEDSIEEIEDLDETPELDYKRL